MCDPPPRFSRKSDWAFEAELHTGLLLAACVGVAAPRDAVLIAGLNALTVTDERFREMIDEAARLGGRSLEIVRWIGAGPDFPKCPYRPTARFAEIRVGDADEGAKTTLADELVARDEGGDDEDDEDDEGEDEYSSEGRDADENRNPREKEKEKGTEKKKETETEKETSDETNGVTNSDATKRAPSSSGSGRASFACELCGSAHASRNRLFRHYRDVRTECGAWIARQGGIAEATARIARGEVVSPTFDPPRVRNRQREEEEKKEPGHAQRRRDGRRTRVGVRDRGCVVVHASSRVPRDAFGRALDRRRARVARHDSTGGPTRVVGDSRVGGRAATDNRRRRSKGMEER